MQLLKSKLQVTDPSEPTKEISIFDDMNQDY